MYTNRRPAKRTIFHTAGWLFADLLLALTIIFIAASTTGKLVSHAKIPIPTATPTPTPTPPPQGLDTNAFTMTLTIDPFQLGQSNTITQIQNQVSQQLDQSHNSNRKAGFVLTFAGGADGVTHAASFNTTLMTMPAFKNAVFRNYHDLTHPDNEFDLEVYFFLT